MRFPQASKTLNQIVFDAIVNGGALDRDFYADAQSLIKDSAIAKAAFEHLCQAVNSVCPVSEGPEAEVYRPVFEFFIEQCGDINELHSSSGGCQFNLFHRVAFLACPLATRIILEHNGDAFIHDQKKKDPRYPFDWALEYGPQYRQWSLVTAEIIFEAMATQHAHDMPGFYNMLSNWPCRQNRKEQLAKRCEILFADENRYVPNWREVLRVQPQRKPQIIQTMPEDDGMKNLGASPHLRLASYD